MTSPPLRVARACQTAGLTLVDTLRTLPSQIPTCTNDFSDRREETPPVPAQLTSGRSSLGGSRALKVPCKKRPSIQAPQRSPAMCLPSFQSATPASGLMPLSASLSSCTCCRCTVTGLVLPSPLSVSPVIKVLLVPSVTS